MPKGKQKEIMFDFLSTTNPCTVADVDQCRNKEQLRNLIIRRQPKFEQKIEAGGALNYLNEAYNFIMAEEKLKSANKQKLTAMEKNKLAIMYMEMRQEADIRNKLCDEYKIDPLVINSDKTRAAKQAEAEIKKLEVELIKKAEK